VRRADRLFLIIHNLRGRRAIPARRLAEALSVSLRTVYRDVADLQLSGVPIEGEAGVGYTLRKGSDIPPLMFDRTELEALVVGARFTQALAGKRLADGARQALVKIEAVLPEELRRRSERSRILAPVVGRRAAERERLDGLHQAIDERRLVRLSYVRGDGASSVREVEPICLAFWGQSWTLGAWCRTRQDFRNFRLDRTTSVETLSEGFTADPARDLRAYLDSVGAGPEFEV
jgi:predicted DNA-binding transcriptional regulator YafY